MGRSGGLLAREGAGIQPTGRRQEQSQRRRERILEAARSCFGEHGFAGATIEAIASEAGVSNGLLYQFFRGKADLFQVVVSEVIRDWARAFVPAESEGLSPNETLEALFRRSVAFCRSNPLLPAILTKSQLLELERVGHPEQDRIHAYRELVGQVLRDGIVEGEFRANLDVGSVADVIVQLHVDYATRAYRRDPQFPANDELIDAAVRFVHDAVRAQSGTGAA
jgi:AcrR family transcriptional regulator